MLVYSFLIFSQEVKGFKWEKQLSNDDGRPAGKCFVD